MNEKLQNKKSIDILMVTFNRKDFLKQTVKKIYERTNYPHRFWVIDNNSTDGTQHWLKTAKLHGYIYDYLFLEENIGLAGGFSKGFEHISKQKGGISEFVIQTQDDIIPPKLIPCWLERMVNLFEKYGDEYFSIAMRIQRTRHKDIDESKELIPASNSCPSVFRISKKQDIIDMGNFGYAKHWETVSFSNKMKKIGKPRLALATHLYADHIGFMSDNKGFKEGTTEHFTYAENKLTQHTDQPYPDIHNETNIPLKVNNPRDLPEHKKREAFFKLYGFDMDSLIIAEKIMKYKNNGGDMDKINNILNI